MTTRNASLATKQMQNYVMLQACSKKISWSLLLQQNYWIENEKQVHGIE